MIAVCCEIHTKHKNMLRGPIIECLNVKLGGIYSNRYFNARQESVLVILEL